MFKVTVRVKNKLYVYMYNIFIITELTYDLT